MRLGPVLLRAGIVVGIALAASQAWLVQRAHAQAARFIAQLMPQGELRYERLLPLPWGAGRAWGLSFRPEGLLRVNLQTAPGFRVDVRELWMDTVRRNADGHLERLSGRLIGMRVPVQAWRSPAPDSADPMRVAPPTLFELGYRELEFDVAFDIRYLPGFELALLDLDLYGASLGRAALRLQLEGGPRTFSRAPDQIRMRKLVLEYVDRGLLARYREGWAARSRVGLPAWEAAAVEHLDRRAAREKWNWDAKTADAARQLIRDPSHLRARFDPPGDVLLRNLRLYALADWPSRLGFTLSSQAEIDHADPIPPSMADRFFNAVLSGQDRVSD